MRALLMPVGSAGDVHPYLAVGAALKGVHPCSTGLIVNGLARPELMMEIDIEAVIPDDEL